MPRLQISTSCAGPFTALIYRDECVVEDFEPWHKTSRNPVCAFDESARRTKISNIKAQASSVFTLTRFLPDPLEDSVNTIIECI